MREERHRGETDRRDRETERGRDDRDDTDKQTDGQREGGRGAVEGW